jgi:hypothetical protein
VVVSIDPDHGSETAAAAGFDPRERIFDEQGSRRHGAESPCGEQEGRGVGFARQPVVGRNHPIHYHVEQSEDTAGVEHVVTVPTGRYDCDVSATRP